MDEFDAIDIEIGRRVREARQAARLTQRELGSRIGVTFQQVQKYEAGRSRLAVAMLCEIARALGVAPASLVAGLLGEPVIAADALGPRERELIGGFRALSDAQQMALLGLLRSLSSAGS